MPQTDEATQDEGRQLLAKMTAERLAAALEYVSPLALIAADQALDQLIRAAQEEIRFAHRVGLLDEDGAYVR